MAALSAVLVFAGLVLIWNYLKLKRMHLETIDAEITDIYTRQLSKGSKILKADKFTYYPVVTYEIDGKKNIRRCLTNASGERTFKKGDTLKLYYEPETGAVREKHANPIMLAGGIVLFLAGAAAELSILSVTM